jgi:hypothetical protein
MFNLFKNIDDKVKDLGFTKVHSSKLVECYERKNEQFNYTHCVDIIRKTKRIPIVQSYQKDTDNMVGLNIIEANIFINKIKKLGWFKR